MAKYNEIIKVGKSKPSSWSDIGITGDDGIAIDNENKRIYVKDGDVVRQVGSGISEVRTPTRSGVGPFADRIISLDSDYNNLALTTDGRLPAAYFDGLMDKIKGYDSYEDFPQAGSISIVYADSSTGDMYKYNGSEYVMISKSGLISGFDSNSYAKSIGSYGHSNVSGMAHGMNAGTIVDILNNDNALYNKIYYTGIGSGSKFGNSVAISGDRCIVGAHEDNENGSDSGSAHIYDVKTGNKLRSIFQSDPISGDGFGMSVDIDGSSCIVGAYEGKNGGSYPGFACIFDVDSGQQLHKIFAEDGYNFDYFGYSVGISGDKCIIGSYRDDDSGDSSGSAYIFDVTTGEQLFKLLSDDGTQYDYFGYSVSVSGDRCVIGAHNNSDNGSGSGSAYIFDVSTGQQLFKLLAGDGAARDYFGYSVSISGDRCIIGAYGDDDNGDNSGSAYIFDVNTGQQLFKLLPGDGADYDYFGRSVSISGNRCIVGAHGDDDNGSDSGSAYIFDVTTGEQLYKISDSSGSENDYFGYSVDIDDGYCIAGSDGPKTANIVSFPKDLIRKFLS